MRHAISFISGPGLARARAIQKLKNEEGGFHIMENGANVRKMN